MNPLALMPAGIKGMGATVHGTVRSCFKDWCSENGYPDQLSEMALDHLVGDATRNAYARSDLWLARQEMMGAWSDFVVIPPAPELALGLGSIWNY